MEKIYTNDDKLQFIDFLMITTGAAIYAFSFVTINMGDRLADGGISGITLILKFLFNINPAISTIVLNVPLLMIGYYYLGKIALIYTIYGTLVLSFWIWLWQFLHVSLNIHHNLFIASILAGILGGIGLGLVYRFNGTTGGTDIIARIFEKKKGISMGQSLFALDVIVLLLSLTYIDLTRMMYTVVVSYVFSRVVNFIQDGGYAARGMIIMTWHPEEISHDIINKMRRGVTYINIQGAFSQHKGKALYCVVSRNEITTVKKIINKYDTKAFISIFDVNEVIGDGFTFNVPKKTEKIKQKLLRR